MVCNFPLGRRDHFLKSQPRGTGTYDSPVLRVPPAPTSEERPQAIPLPTANAFIIEKKRIFVGRINDFPNEKHISMHVAWSHGGPVNAERPRPTLLSKLTASRCSESRTRAQRAMCNLVPECLCSCKCKVSLILRFTARGFCVA